eukprot:11178296-Lingulodinium_polyedra.AAC.1
MSRVPAGAGSCQVHGAGRFTVNSATSMPIVRRAADPSTVSIARPSKQGCCRGSPMPFAERV